MYTLYRAPGWHSEPEDPEICQVETEEEAALLAGERIDIHMPGGSNRYDSYALDEDGNRVDRIMSYRCDECDEVIPWGDDGPVGLDDAGEILECPGGREKHTVTWVCEHCACSGRG